jgi:xylulokinase
MYLGIDIGTSGVKAVLVDDDQAIVGQANAALDVSRPQPLWSEQDPQDWWRAVLAVMSDLKSDHAKTLAAVRGIGLSGQMHGASVLDKDAKPLRPAILWNDGRSQAECAELEKKVPGSRTITGNLAMPGFTAPKLLWLKNNEPDVFSRIDKVLLPKDYVRLRLTGAYVSEMSDAAGTLWLDVARRDWSDDMLNACELSRDHMPRLVEGSEPSGSLRPELVRDWGMNGDVIVAGGAGDNAAGAVGVGTVVPGRAFLSLGTSGVYFVANEKFSPNPEQAVHAFCHCLPGTWHQMSVILSAASCLTWVTAISGAVDEASLLAEVEAGGLEKDSPVFLPYLSGERTPHNNPRALGVFFGMTHETDRAAMGRAVLEGVAFAFADGQDALLAAGADIESVSVIGGGARSPLWGRILASVLERPLVYHSDGEVGPAFGAARLGRLAVGSEDPEAVCTAPAIQSVIEPETGLESIYGERRTRFRRLYTALEQEFTASAA